MIIKYLTSIEAIEKFSRVIRYAFIFLILLEFIRAVVTLIVFFTGNGGYLLTENNYSFHFKYFSDGSEYVQPDLAFAPFGNFNVVAKILYLFGTIPIYYLTLKNLYHLQRLFCYYTEGKIFTSEASGEIRRIGIIFCWFALFAALSELLQRNAIILTLSGHICGLQLYLETWGKIFGFLLIGGMVVCISWIMETGREMREDQELAI